MSVRLVDEAGFGLGWIDSEDPLARASHALAVDGRVFLVDPLEAEGIEERIRALGEPEAVLVLLDRHRRDADAFAARLGIPVHETPFDGLAGTPFELRTVVRNRFWREVALWWPERRTLVAADALGTLGYFHGGEGPLGVHPMLRFRPPRKALAGVEPEHVLVGHGEGVHGPEAAEALARALGRARRGIPRWLAWGARSLVRR